MSPLVWSNLLAASVAAIPVVWLVTIDVGSSRRMASEAGDVVVDESTSHLFDLVAGLALVVAVGASLGLTALTIPVPVVSWAMGMLSMAGAIALSAAARRRLGRFHQHALMQHRDHDLVTDGPYARLRHPLYTATVLAFVGIGAVLGNWLSLGLLALAPTTVLVHRIGVEERMLVDRFGADYDRYAAGRARLVPGIW